MAKNRKTLTLLLILIMILLLGGGGSYFFLSKARKERVPVSGEAKEGELENKLKLARYYMEKEEYDLARTQLEEVLIKDPENEEALELLEEAGKAGGRAARPDGNDIERINSEEGNIKANCCP
jgi:Tfp pilus assembly protein PilF